MPSHPERIGPYEITGKLGEGGMGVVYHAQDTRLNRAVALKMIRDSCADENLRKRFLREAQSAARVNHPSICRLYDIGEEDGRPFLVMELLEGESLACRLAHGPIDLAEAVQVALSMLSALAALHRCSILHRDLKPSNVFLSTQGVKLLDFGLAKPIAPEHDPDGQTATELTREGVIAATPRYASPEQITGKPMDSRSDLFSTAAVLFEMLRASMLFPATPRSQSFMRFCTIPRLLSADLLPLCQSTVFCIGRSPRVLRTAFKQRMRWPRSYGPRCDWKIPAPEWKPAP